MSDLKPRSFDITDGADRVAHRALLFADGLTRADLSKPLVAVVNSWNEIVPGCIHLPMVGRAVHEGVIAAGGVPLEFNTDRRMRRHGPGPRRHEVFAAQP